MNNKLAITLLALMALTPIALAQETNETEMEVMHTPIGVLLRFVQLDRQIELRTIRGNAIIQAMNELNNTVDTSVLATIISELDTVQANVRNYTTPTQNVNLTDRAEKFVDLKTDAIELVNDFRNETRILLVNYNMTEFNARIKSINENTTKVNELNNKVRDYIREYNAERINKTLTNLGIKNDSLIEHARNGTLKQELKNQIRNNYEMKKTEIKQAILTLKNELATEKTTTRQLLSNITAGYMARQQERLNMNFANLTRLKDKIRTRIGGTQ